jgi:hypothetical protein
MRYLGCDSGISEDLSLLEHGQTQEKASQAAALGANL